MKKLLLTITLLPLIGFGQDNILLHTGEDILSKVIEINQEQIKYKKYTNIEGPVYTINKEDVFIIRYENGEKDIFSKHTNESNEYIIKGENAADTLHSAGPSFIGGVGFGLIGGAVISSLDANRLPPYYAKDVSDMYQSNRNFQKGYRLRSKQINVTAGWIGAGVGTLLSIIYFTNAN